MVFGLSLPVAWWVAVPFGAALAEATAVALVDAEGALLEVVVGAAGVLALALAIGDWLEALGGGGIMSVASLATTAVVLRFRDETPIAIALARMALAIAPPAMSAVRLRFASALRPADDETGCSVVRPTTAEIAGLAAVAAGGAIGTARVGALSPAPCVLRSGREASIRMRDCRRSARFAFVTSAP